MHQEQLRWRLGRHWRGWLLGRGRQRPEQDGRYYDLPVGMRWALQGFLGYAPTFVARSTEAKVRRDTWRDKSVVVERGMALFSRSMIEYFCYGIEEAFWKASAWGYSVMAGGMFGRSANKCAHARRPPVPASRERQTRRPTPQGPGRLNPTCDASRMQFSGLSVVEVRVLLSLWRQHWSSSA